MTGGPWTPINMIVTEISSTMMDEMTGTLKHFTTSNLSIVSSIHIHIFQCFLQSIFPLSNLFTFRIVWKKRRHKMSVGVKKLATY